MRSLGSASALYEWLAERADGLAAAGARRFGFAGRPIALTVYGDRWPDYLDRALEPDETADEPAFFSVELLDGAACGVPRPPLGAQPSDFGLGRRMPGWSTQAGCAFYMRSEEGVAVADWSARRAIDPAALA